MKKKCVIILAVVLVVLCCCFTLVACNNRYEVTVHWDNVTSKYEVASGYGISQIGFPYYLETSKHGYYLTGYWDKPSGGKKYYGTDGLEVQEWEWDETYPTDLYAQWKPASGYQSEVTKWESTYSFYTHRGSFSDGYCIRYNLNAEEKSLIDGNMDKTIEISFSGRIMAPAENIKLYFQDKHLSGYEVYHSETVSITPGSYVDFSYKVQCSAKIFANNYEMSFRFYADYFLIASATYIKELKASFRVL